MKIKNALVILFILFFCGCAKRYTKDEKIFYEYLGDNYKAYGDYKAENYDWKGARLFYKKANIISKSKELKPENVSVNIKMSIVDFLAKKDMSDRMLLILNDNNAKQQYPEEIANLQFYFDCWIIEDRLYSRYGQMSRCKQGFIDALSYLEFKLLRLNTTERDLIVDKIDEKPSEISVYKRQKKYIVEFNFDSSAITEGSSSVIWDILNEIKAINGKYVVNVVGHADRVGTKKYNESLSKRRTNTVKHYLTKNGVPESVIKITWLGEIEPQVITDNDTKESLNRRVTVSVDLIK